MALYEVTRTDTNNVKPGEFISAFIVAGGTAQARKAVAHMSGVTPKNTTADRVDTAGHVTVLSTYFDERDPEPEHIVDAHGYPMN